MPKGTVLITGGAGYIGSHANLALIQAGYDTVVLDNLVRGRRSFVQWGDFWEGDCSDSANLDRLFSQKRFDAVMHFAAYAYVGESVLNPSMYYANNVSATLTLMDAMVRHNVPAMVFSSSCAVYGEPYETPLTESHATNPINPYGRTKLFIEEALKDYYRAYGLRSISLRYFNAAGADPELRVGEWHTPETHLIPLALEAAIDESNSFSIFGDDFDTPDGSCIRDFVHVCDIADAHMLSLEHLLNGGSNDVFNLGTERGMSVLEVLDSIERLTGQRVRREPAARRSGDPSRLVGSARRIKNELGWNPKFTDLDEILATAWEWRKKRGD